MNHTNFIMRPFNSTFWLCFIFFAMLLVFSTLILKNKDIKIRKTIFVSACILTLIGFFIYKYFLSIDAEYDKLRSFIGGFNWFGELPLHMCNVNMILMPIAVLFDNKKLMIISFYLAPLGAFMALIMPGSGFINASIFEPRMIGYYGTHFMIMIEGIALVTYDFFKPTIKEIPRTIISTWFLTLGIHLINLAMRYSHLYDRANYFYTVETEQNFLLDIFYKFIPIPFLYLSPCVIILGIYMLIVTFPFDLSNNKRI